MIGVPVLIWQPQTHATISGHFLSVYNLEWLKSSNDRYVPQYSVGLVAGTASCFDL